MRLIKKLLSRKEIVDFVDIVSDAYPGIKLDSAEAKVKQADYFEKFQKDNPFVKYYGVFQEEEMVGGMRLHDFKMNLLNTKVKAGGIGQVAVHILHKKEKVARDIIEFFISHYKSLGASIVLLYPFRPDFYKKMGFGFGTSMNQYKVKPRNLPKGSAKAHIKYLKEEDASELTECYNRIFNNTNGLIEKYETDFKFILNNPRVRVAAYRNNEKIEGYIVYEYKAHENGNRLLNDMLVTDLVFENREALSELMCFLNSQDDQIRHVIFNIQDEDFKFLLDDPRNDTDNMFAPVFHECSIQGTGIMYRVIDTKGIFKDLKEHNFNNITCRLKLTIKDSFLKDNEGSIIVHFNNGFATISDSEIYDVEVCMEVADFSSLITCSVSFRSLYRYGRASVSDERLLEEINTLFASDEKPICLTRF
jgi:predicted acetyltransferase